MMRRLFAYGAVGMVGAAIYFFTTIFCVEIINFSPVLSSGLAYIASFTFSFLANHYFVFESDESIKKTIIKFSAVSAFGFSLTTAIMYCTVGILNIPYLYGVGLVLVVIPMSNYFLNLLWTFRATSK